MRAPEAFPTAAARSAPLIAAPGRKPRPLAAALAPLAIASLLFASFPAAAGTITWWHWYPPEAWASYAPLVADFERETGIDVEPQYVGWSTMKDKLLIAIVGGIYPDVVTVSSRWADGLAEQGAFVRIDSWIGSEAQGFFPVALELWRTAGGTQYALPLDLDVPALFFNREMFAARGIADPGDLGWEEWFDLTRRLARDRDGDGDLDEFGLTTWWYPWITLVWANGGTIVQPGGTGLGLGAPDAREAIEFYRRLHDEGPIPQVRDANRLGAADPAELWKRGEVGMAPAGAWMPRYHLTDPESAEGAFRFDFGVTELPKGTTGLRAAPAEGSGIAVVRGTPHEDAAWLFAQYVASEPFMSRVAERLEGFPAHIDAARDVLARSGGEPFVRAVGYARPFPKGVDWWGSLSPIVMRELGRYLEGSTGLDAAIENIERQARALFAR